jgi:hypothetical protein
MMISLGLSQECFLICLKKGCLDLVEGDYMSFGDRERMVMDLKSFFFNTLLQ